MPLLCIFFSTHSSPLFCASGCLLSSPPLALSFHLSLLCSAARAFVSVLPPSQRAGMSDIAVSACAYPPPSPLPHSSSLFFLLSSFTQEEEEICPPFSFFLGFFCVLHLAEAKNKLQHKEIHIFMSDSRQPMDCNALVWVEWWKDKMYCRPKLRTS